MQRPFWNTRHLLWLHVITVVTMALVLVLNQDWSGLFTFGLLLTTVVAAIYSILKGQK